MGRTCDKRIALRLFEALVFQIWLQLLKPREVVSEQHQVLQYCNFTTKPAAVLPFNERYNDQEVIKGQLKVRFSNAHFVPGINGEAGGAMRLKGQQDSYVEIEANEQVRFDQSMTILLYINPLRNLPGPLVHYKANGHGVQLWIQGTISEKGRLMARFNQRSLNYTEWLRADVLNLAQWNFVGASYDHVTGWATLYHDGWEVRRTFIGKDLHLATGYEVRIGAVDSSFLGHYNGDVACLQFYSKALNIGEVTEVQNACKAVVPLQFLFLNLTSPVHVAEANETLLTVTADTNDNVTKPSFRFDFGDGMVTQESFFNTASTMYHFIGNYTLQVQAWSLCNTSMLIDTAKIVVPKPVGILKNISLHGKATVFGETTHFRLLVEQGTDFSCLWLLGDHGNQTTSSSNPGITVLNHVYATPATYKVNVTCKNRRSELAVSEIVQVQKVIIGLKILPILPTLYGRDFLVRWQIDDGTGVVYKANFSKSLLKVEKSEDELYGQAIVTQNDYKTPGEFSVHVAASNAVTKWISKSVKCIILQSVSPFLPILQVRDIEINETISIWFTNVNSGPEINASYLVTFGDNSKAVDTRETLVNHTYSHHGLYTVNISAINEVSSFNTSLIIKVHKPVIKLERAVIPSLAAKVNKAVNITMFITRGSDFVCHWQFGDDLELTQNLQDELFYLKDSDLNVKKFINITISARHTFKEVGIYNVSATCQNRWSEVKAMGYVTVQKEITLFQVLSVGAVVFGKTFFLNMTTATGTNVTFKAFLDQQELYIENHYFYQVCKVTPDIYKQAGQYNITVIAKNLVTPQLHHTEMVFVEIPVSKVRINTSYLEDKTLHAGHGKEMNIFPGGLPVVFKATAENGSGLEYLWSINDGKDLFTGKTILHTFYTPGTYTVSILVENHVSRVSSSVVIVVHERPSLLKGGTVKCSSPKVVKEIVTIQITIEILGTNSTLFIELDNNTSYCYGNIESYVELTKNDKNTTVQYRGVLKKNIILQHVYNTQGIYTVKARLGNAVSRSSTTCEVEILSRPCKKPKVKLKGVGDIPDDARHFFRADVISIEAEVDVFCPESKGSMYKWKIFQRDPKTGAFKNFHDFILNGEASMQEIKIKRRTLPFGLFRLRLTVGMVEEYLKDFLTVAEGYIRVVQSPLIAKISGGSEIRRGFGTVLSIDGLGSHDPDVGPENYTGIQFMWLCRNVSESFPEVIKEMIDNGTVDILPDHVPGFSSSSDQGCYRDGQYLLSKTMFLELTTNRMMQNETYVIVLVIRKGERTSSTTQILELGPENLPKLTIS